MRRPLFAGSKPITIHLDPHLDWNYINLKYEQLGGETRFGRAITDLMYCADGAGRFVEYERGVIYFHPKVRGAFAVQGAILEKWTHLGREQYGYPFTDETAASDHIGRYSHFRSFHPDGRSYDASIYWTPSTGAFEVRGGIRQKWATWGWERGMLGYPVTDETGAPDGIGRYSHFQNGSIYWTPETGAQIVYGGIREKWASLGWERSYLGYPIDDEQPFSQGGRVSPFQHGAIYWWPDTGAIDLNDVVVHYTGLHCFGDTDGLGSDEPYVSIGVAAPTSTTSYSSRIYEDVDAGESQSDWAEIYRGKPYGLDLSVLLMEHDLGDPNKYRWVVQTAVDKGAEGVKEGIKQIPPPYGPAIAVVAETLLKEVVPIIVDVVNNLLGTGDDKIGETTMPVTAKELIVGARAANSIEGSIGYNLVTPLLSGNGGSYKVYFDVAAA